MPRRRPLDQYPQEYYDLFSKANYAPVEMEFDRASEAVGFRIEMYNFRRALRESLLLNPNNSDVAEAVALAESLTFPLSGTTLTIKVKDSIQAQRIRKVL